MAKKVSKSLKDTEILARQVLRTLRKEDTNHARVVALSGNLGAGKTAFVKAVGKLLGVKSTVNSPTFVIVKRHLVKRGPHKTLFHIDAYRLKDEKELRDLGWEDIVKDKNNLVFIEWPERVRKAIPRHTKKIKISHRRDGHRQFEI